MRCFCDNCDRFVDTISDTVQRRSHTATIKGREVAADEEYLVCPNCGGYVYTNAMVNANVHAIHNAYRLAIGSITAEEIRDLLNTYAIGAQPMSKLLGWGENTIERQMKHTIPDREHARRLRELKDPGKMLEILEANKGAISECAYRKARNAAEACLLILEPDFGRNQQKIADIPFPLFQNNDAGHFINNIKSLFKHLSPTKAYKRIDNRNHEQEKRVQFQFI